MARSASRRGRSKEFGVRFQPVSLPFDFPPKGSEEEAAARARKMPRGKRRLWGIPFELAPEGEGANAVRLANGAEMAVPIGAPATHLCVLHYWEGGPARDEDQAGGRTVGTYVLRYADGQSHAAPVRTRFEIGWAAGGVRLYAGVHYDGLRTLDFMNPQVRGGWGGLQQDVAGGMSGEPWLYALPNPRPDAPVESVVLRGMDAAPLCVLGLTLYAGPGHPLRHNARRYFRLTLPPDADLQSLDVDLGVLVRDAGPAAPRGEGWLDAVEAGLGVPAGEGLDGTVRLLEISAADGAILTVALKERKEGARTSKRRLSVGEALQEGSSAHGNGKQNS